MAADGPPSAAGVRRLAALLAAGLAFCEHERESTAAARAADAESAHVDGGGELPRILSRGQRSAELAALALAPAEGVAKQRARHGMTLAHTQPHHLQAAERVHLARRRVGRPVRAPAQLRPPAP